MACRVAIGLYAVGFIVSTLYQTWTYASYPIAHSCCNQRDTLALRYVVSHLTQYCLTTVVAAGRAAEP